MKKTLFLLFAATTSLLCSSCFTSKKFLESYAPEESSLNLVKITDESKNTVVAPAILTRPRDFANSKFGGNIKNGIYWSTLQCLSLSPDGNSLAYITQENRQNNIMVRKAGPQGVSTQRTFRNVMDMSWGSDGNIYFSDINASGYSSNTYICSVKGESGSMMSQHTNGNVTDTNPVFANNDKIFFTRIANGSPSIWSLDKKDGTLTSCARGYNPCPDPKNPGAFYCVRNNSNGRSEIWYIEYVIGKETLIVSDDNRSFTNPQLSPNGKWLLMVGNTKSSISKKNNLDVFVVRTDGTQLTQLTYHPDNDVAPIWSNDGKSIFFISSRANKESYYNVWRMNFNIE